MEKVIEEIETKHEYDQVTCFVVPFCGFGESTFKEIFQHITHSKEQQHDTHALCVCVSVDSST